LILFLFKNTKSLVKVYKNIVLPSVIVSLTLPVFSQNLTNLWANSNQTISQRLTLSIIAAKMIQERFLIGEGLNTFIIKSVIFKIGNSYLWLLQPVHNIFLLVFSETGIFGLLLMCFLFNKLISKSLLRKNIFLAMSVIFIIITSLFDHYWFTIQQNLLLFSLLSGLIF
jgi:O-antigen ligase